MTGAGRSEEPLRCGRLVTAGATGCKTVCALMLRLKGDGHADRARGRLGGAFAMGYLVVRPHGAYFGDNEALGDTAAARASLPVSVPGLFGLSLVMRKPVGVFDRPNTNTTANNVSTAAHVRAAYDVAAGAMVLLQNRGEVLPLRRAG